MADHFAVHDRAPGTPAPDAVLVLDDGAIAVFRGEPDATVRRTGRIGPVYRSRQGRMAVPTGRILVRFRDGVPAESRRSELQAAGYEIEETLAYSAEAAWVRPKEDLGADPLSHADALRKLADVENVEPEMLTSRAHRGDG
jgi:hypothetical protein